MTVSRTAALVSSELSRRESCQRLETPLNGDLNCLSWTWGQLCRPSCLPGHVFFRPLPSAVYLCGRDRRWKPGSTLPDCSRKFFQLLRLIWLPIRPLDGVDCSKKIIILKSNYALSMGNQVGVSPTYKCFWQQFRPCILCFNIFFKWSTRPLLLIFSFFSNTVL